LSLIEKEFVKKLSPFSLNKIVAPRRIIPTNDFGLLRIGFSGKTL
jgi:hypothetical protein